MNKAFGEFIYVLLISWAQKNCIVRILALYELGLSYMNERSSAILRHGDTKNRLTTLARWAPLIKTPSYHLGTVVFLYTFIRY